jgi:hypothetical protein
VIATVYVAVLLGGSRGMTVTWVSESECMARVLDTTPLEFDRTEDS